MVQEGINYHMGDKRITPPVVENGCNIAWFGLLQVLG